MNRKCVLMTLMGLDIGGAETHIIELSKALSKNGYRVILASNGGIYEKELIKNNIKHYKTPLHNKKLFSLIKSYRIIDRIIRYKNIDIINNVRKNIIEVFNNLF